MKFHFTTLITVLICVLIASELVVAQGTLRGMVTDQQDGEPLVGANILLTSEDGRTRGAGTDLDGVFEIRNLAAGVYSARVSYVGYTDVRITDITIISGQTETLNVSMTQGISLNPVVLSASRVQENILDAPVTIERMDVIAINNTPSDNYYKSIGNLKGIDITTSSINFQILNARGFSSTGNTRMVQFIDGMDTQAPALNFPISNLNGPSELDVESLEFIPGSASALYGPNAFNGVLLMNSKNPFSYPGLSVFVRSGFNHIGSDEDLGEPGSAQPMFETSFRYAHVFNNRFAFKANFSYMQANDWRGINYSDKNANLQGNLSVNPAYDGVHLFGDDASFNLGLLGLNPAFIQGFAALTPLNEAQASAYISANLPAQPVNRTGYREQYLVDHDAENMKISTSLHYRLTDDIEANYSFNYGYGTTVYTGAQRYSLKNFFISQHKLELNGDNFMLRGYGTFENSGDSYIADFVGFAVNEAYLPSTQWFPTYGIAYLGYLLQNGVGFDGSSTVQQRSAAHVFARNTADANRTEPGSSQFEEAKEAALLDKIPDGALFNDKSRFFHIDGLYDFKNEIDFMSMQVGASFRQFQLRSNGTIFDDEDGIDINEYGAFLQLGKPVLEDRLRLSGSVRYDKNENFDGQFSPRVAAVASVAPNHNVRASFQTGFRNPSTQGQYIDLNVISARLIGGLPRFADKYRVSESTFTIDSVMDFTNSVLTGSPDPGLLVPFTHVPVKPEQIKAIEFGYKGLFGNNLFIDAAYYYNIFDDFITQIRVRQLQGPDGSILPVAPQTLPSLLSGDFRNTFQIYTNTDKEVHAHGAVLGFDYNLPQNYQIGFNYNWNKLISGLGTFQNDFNTPEHKFNIMFSNRRVTQNLGFNITYRWQDAFRWESSFAFADVPAVSMLDAQVTYRVPHVNTTVKVGGSNVLNESYILSGGGPSVGAIYYISLTYDSVFRR
ncbi:MAG: TonB-dependent receptor domain-containing protein [Cyclonatronaceae bacterium]